MEWTANDVSQLVFITFMKFYNKVPTSMESNGNLRFKLILQSYRNAADVVKESGLTYTIFTGCSLLTRASYLHFISIAYCEATNGQ